MAIKVRLRSLSDRSRRYVLKRPKSKALPVKGVDRVLDTTEHSLNEGLSRKVLAQAFDLADGGLLLVFESGKGRLYASKDEFQVVFDELERQARQGPVSICRDLHQGRAFAEQVPQLVRRLPTQLNIDASQLDGTEASLDKVDEALRRIRPQRFLRPEVFASLTAYVGEVICNATKGRWEMRQGSDPENTWEPWVVDPSGRTYAPFKIYKELLEYGRSGSLRVFVTWELGK